MSTRTLDFRLSAAQVGLRVGSPSVTCAARPRSALPVYIVALREIRAEVAAAALLAPQRRARDQQPTVDEAGERGAARDRRCGERAAPSTRRARHAESRVHGGFEAVLRTARARHAATSASRTSEADRARVATAVRRGRPARRARPSRSGASRGVAVIASAARAPNTSPSSSELLASRLAPWTPGARHLAGGEQPVDRRPAVEVGLDPAHHVVRGRTDRNAIGGQVESRRAGTPARSSGTGGARNADRDAPSCR